MIMTSLIMSERCKSIGKGGSSKTDIRFKDVIQTVNGIKMPRKRQVQRRQRRCANGAGVSIPRLSLAAAAKKRTSLGGFQMRVDGLAGRREGEMRGRVRRQHLHAMALPTTPLSSLLSFFAWWVRSAPFCGGAVGRSGTYRHRRVFTEPQHNFGDLAASKSTPSADRFLLLSSCAHNCSLCGKRRLYTANEKGGGRTV